MRRKLLSVLLLVCAALVAALSGCESGSADSDENLLLYLSFDEGSGTTITDASGNLPDGELNYVYTNALYMDSQDPQWRTSAVYGGALLFDGSSTSITYSKSDLQWRVPPSPSACGSPPAPLSGTTPTRRRTAPS